MKVFVTGGTGLIGRALVKGMLSDGYEVTVLTRQSLESYGRLQYVQSLSDIPEGLDAVVNLAGAGLADKRWSEGYKREILDSRITLTRDLVDQLSVKGMPKVFVSGSAIGFMALMNMHLLRNLIMPVKVFQLICAPIGRQRHEEQSPRSRD